MMKKIGIVTLTKNPNYGNALQNIAMQWILRKMGTNPQTIVNYDGSSLFVYKGNIRYYAKMILNKHNMRAKDKRRIQFLKCLTKYVEFSKAFWMNNHIQNFDSDSYDYFITGSDQVWNPFFGVASSFEMLDFVPSDKRISYAASFGVNSLNGLDESKTNFIAQSLRKFNSVSVREEAGVEIVRELSGVKAELCLDPTMLMTPEEWDDLLEKPKQKLPNRYIAVYMLGDITAEYEKNISSIAEAKEAEVINLLTDKFFYLNPLEFAWIIKNALFVCTDSFHATVFSILYHRNFKIFDRKDKHENQNSRFDTLLSICGIIDSDNINWNATEECISLERERSINYLKNALGEKEYEN